MSPETLSFLFDLKCIIYKPICMHNKFGQWLYSKALFTYSLTTQSTTDTKFAICIRGKQSTRICELEMFRIMANCSLLKISVGYNLMVILREVAICLEK